jgi:beta-lactamase class A
LSGKTQWLDGKLWYEANWQSLKLSGAGWASASVVTMTAPPADDAAAWASFDALSPSLAKYLASYGTNVSSVVYDVTRGRYYSYNENTPFILASSSKVSILVSYLWWLESQGRGPNASEIYTLTNMIEHSDNNAAQLLFDRLGGSNGQLAFYKKIGVTGYISSPYGWGWALLPPLGQMQVLTLLQQGKILTAHDREFALNLMRNIELDQRMGVGVTLPPGATVAMKDGWVPAPNGLWAINTSGIVTAGGETYIIVVYTANQSDYFGAWNITQRVCKEVGQLLTAP